MTADERARRTADADALCAKAWAGVGGPDVGLALVAVGGYGRGELAPHSDLDLVLVSDPTARRRRAAAAPDRRAALVPAVGLRRERRPLGARRCPRWSRPPRPTCGSRSGLLDVRHLTGDPNLTLRLRTTMLAQWRRDARERLPELHKLVRSRHDLMGELAHESVPDLKEAEGGVRDATVLKSLVATWLVDVPHVELERSRMALLDVRDLVHDLAGRATDRIAPELWTELGAALRSGWDADARAAQVHVRELGRRITHLSRLTWRRVDDALARPAHVGVRRPSLTPLAEGVALAANEVVLDRRARPAEDPALLLRAAAEAAERDVVLAPPTAARLARECAPLPDPWPPEARRLLVRLLASGRGLLGTWETLEETGALAQILPEWERIRLLPHASAIHRFTVDRHVVETCIEAVGADPAGRAPRRADGRRAAARHRQGQPHRAQRRRRADRPEHRDPDGVRRSPASTLIALLVRWHLLLAETATTRDPDDPATVEALASRLGSAEALDLLTVLTEADARAASPKAWSSWRSGLILDLSRRTRAALTSGAALPPVANDEVDGAQGGARAAASRSRSSRSPTARG